MNTENHYQETDLGNISLNPRGEYNPEESYEYLDLVVLEGGSYVCLAENGATITGISPESGKTTQYWQVITIPGSLTPEYIAMHDRVVNLSEQVGADAVEVRTAEQNVSGMELNVTQMQEQTRQSAEAAEQSKDSSAGYAASADASRQAAEESKQNIDVQVTGFDSHVAEKTEEAENDIEAARIAANKAIIAQQEQSVNEVARVGSEAVSTAQAAAQTATEKAQAAATSEKNAAASETAAKLSEENATKMAEQVAADKEQVAYDRTAVENAKQEMTGSVAQIEQNTQGIAELKGDIVNKAPARIMNENNVMNNAKIHSGYYDTKHNDSDSYVYFEINVLSGITYGFGAYRPSGIAYPRFISKNGVILQNYKSSISGLCQYTPDFSGKLYVTFRSDATDFVGIINNDESSGTYYKPTIKPLKELEEKVSLTDSILTNSGDFEFSTIKEKLKFDYALQKGEPIDLAKILKWETGGIVSDGTESSDINYRRTGFYKLNGTILANYKGESGYLFCYCYDADKKYVKNFRLGAYTQRNNLLKESNDYCYVRFVLYKDTNPEDSISLLLFQDAFLGRQTKPKAELNSNTKYYFDSDEIDMIITVNSLSDSKVIVYRNGAEETIASNIGFVDFTNNKIGFYKQVGDVDTTTNFEVFVQEDMTLTPTVGRKYHIKSERIDGNNYTLTVTDMVTMESNTITSYAKNVGAGWGYRNYKVGMGIIVDKFNAFATQPLTPKVLVIGDSYVEGNTLWENKEKRWCGKLKTALNGDVFINGQGGAKAYGMHLWFYNYLIDMVRPKYVIIHTYTNDSADALYTDYMQIMIDVIKGILGATPILVKAVPNIACTLEKATFINNWIDASGEKFFDYSECMTVNGDGVTQDTSVYLSDLIHPNEEGHRRIYEKLIADFPELIN